MNRDAIGGTACGHAGKHRGRAGRIGHTACIATGLLNAEHASAYLRHVIQRQLFVNARLYHHLAQFGDVLAHSQREYQFLTRRYQLFLQQHGFIAYESGTNGMSAHGYIINDKVSVCIRYGSQGASVFHRYRHTYHWFARGHVAYMSANGLCSGLADLRHHLRSAKQHHQGCS